jgi:hypothetical protein
MSAAKITVGQSEQHVDRGVGVLSGAPWVIRGPVNLTGGQEDRKKTQLFLGPPVLL